MLRGEDGDRVLDMAGKILVVRREQCVVLVASTVAPTAHRTETDALRIESEFL
jgi:hypothetical protein